MALWVVASSKILAIIKHTQYSVNFLLQIWSEQSMRYIWYSYWPF
jgi:L-ribulose-5-phosphate 3-epimerase UlaE